MTQAVIEWYFIINVDDWIRETQFMYQLISQLILGDAWVNFRTSAF